MLANAKIRTGWPSPDETATALAALPEALAAAGYRGDVLSGRADTAPFATDNSIYRIAPDLVLAPRDAADVGLLMQVMAAPRFGSLPVTARGGGTGTNGQSLNRGVIVNFQKYMHRTLAVNVKEGWADVEPGVVPEDLNAELAEHGLWFGATTSTATRCSIGGMVATDASGKGSRHHGKTGDNILGLNVVLSDGTEISSLSPLPDHLEPRMERAGKAIRAVREDFIAKVPRLSRRFTGYDFERAIRPDGSLDWRWLVVGAEGTLGLVTRIRLRLKSRPAATGLAVIAFATVEQALEAGQPLLEHDPSAIEIMDDTVFRMASETGLLSSLPPTLYKPGLTPALCYVEAEGASESAVKALLGAVLDTAATLPGYLGSHLGRDRDETAGLWSVRASSVALVTRNVGRRLPVAFVEDCMVPLAELAAFTRAFTEGLKQRGLHFGMYGHVDVGCIHIRPALDLSDQADQAMLLEISEMVFALTRKHGGIFWGEHGKGVRGEWLTRMLGPDISDAMLAVRAAFDPMLRMNPGKLVDSPDRLWRIDATPLREVAPPADAPLPSAFYCNGNAECLSVAAGQAMCPSFRATRDLRLSPKGRADTLRDWQLARVAEPAAARAMEPALRSSLDLCLACKACTANCQAAVDIPEMRSRFLDLAGPGNGSRAEERVFVLLEAAAPALAAARKLAAPLSRLAMPAIARGLALRDLPALDASAPDLPVLSARGAAGQDLPPEALLLLPDPFTLLFDSDALSDIARGLRRLGYQPWLARLPSGGKAAHNFGDRRRFAARAQALDGALAALSALGRPMVAADPSLLATVTRDHAHLGLGAHGLLSIPAFLVAEAGAASWPRLSGRLRVLLHCNEVLPGNPVAREWQKIGHALGVEIEASGGICCGMAGHFGHQERHLEISRSIYDASWRDRVGNDDGQVTSCSGFSCRCQVQRMSSVTVRHPLAAIADMPHSDGGQG